MAQCCNDENALWLDSFDDGAPLSGRYINIQGGATIHAGEGIGGTSAAGGIDGANFSLRFDDNLDFCGNYRKSFAIGFYYKPTDADDIDDGVSICEVRGPGSPFVGDRDVIESSLLGIGNHNGHLVISEGTLLHLNDESAYTIYNALPLNELTYVEFRGGTCSWDDATDTGWMEVRINGRVYQFGDDVALVQEDEEPPDCQRLQLRGCFARGWDTIYFEPYGFIDCLYVREESSFCNIPKTTPEKKPCDPPGPGGSSFDGSASGDRIVHRGGYRSSYSAPSSGGTPATAADPTDPQDLSDMTQPLVSLDITLCDGSVVSIAQVAIPRGGGAAPSTDDIERWSPINYPMSDRFGNVQAQTWEVEIADPVGAWRARLASGANKYYRRWRGIAYIEDNAARLVGTARRKLARGRVVSVNTDTELVVKIGFSDELTHHDSPYSLDRELPLLLIGDVFQKKTTGTGLKFTQDAPEDVRGDGLPILLGSCSDERRLLENPPVTPVGICKVFYVGRFLLKNGSERWDGYAVCHYASKRIAGVFGSNQHKECPGSVRIDPDEFSKTFLIPGQGNWSSYFSTNYHDLTIGGVTYRVTMIFARGPVSRAHVEGKVPISVNVDGIETTGNSAGTVINDLAYMCQWLLDHPVLRGTLTGNWGAVSTFSDGTAKIRTSSFAAVKAIHDAQRSGGKKGALIIDKRASARQWLAELLVAGNMELGINHHGQLVLSTFDDTVAVSGLTSYSGVTDIVDDSFKITSEANAELENLVKFEFGPEPATGRVIGKKRPRKIASSITNHDGEFKAEDLRLAAIYDKPVADDTVSRRLIRTEDGITRGEFAVDLGAGELAQGQLIRCSDYRGLGQTGWTDRVLRSTDRMLNPNVSDPPSPQDLIVTVQWEDVHSILVLEGSTTESAVGFHPVGTEGGATAFVAGNEADGTAYRAGN